MDVLGLSTIFRCLCTMFYLIGARYRQNYAQRHPWPWIPSGGWHLLFWGQLLFYQVLGKGPVFWAQIQLSGQGMNLWAEMVRWYREHPGEFYKVYGRRNPIERRFGTIGGRFAYCIRSVTFEMQRRKLAMMSICRIISAWGVMSWLFPRTVWWRGRTVRQIWITHANFYRYV